MKFEELADKKTVYAFIPPLLACCKCSIDEMLTINDDPMFKLIGKCRGLYITFFIEHQKDCDTYKLADKLSEIKKNINI